VPSQSPRPVTEPFAALSGKAVLVIDDFLPLARMVTDVFRGCGASVETATSGHEAMIQVQVGDFDLIVLDLVMPKPDGWEVLEFVTQVAPELLRRTVLLTGDHYNRGTACRALASGLPVIHKPFSVDYLRALSSAVLVRADPPALASALAAHRPMPLALAYAVAEAAARAAAGRACPRSRAAQAAEPNWSLAKARASLRSVRPQ